MIIGSDRAHRELRRARKGWKYVVGGVVLIVVAGSLFLLPGGVSPSLRRQLSDEYAEWESPIPGTLPDGWEAFEDPTTGKYSYENKKLDVSTWDKPVYYQDANGAQLYKDDKVSCIFDGERMTYGPNGVVQVT